MSKVEHSEYSNYLTKKGWDEKVAHTVGTAAEYNKARIALLEEEKALTKKLDELARKRQALPWVEVSKASSYVFHTADGKEIKFVDMFRPGFQDLIVYNFMFGDKETDKACISCSSWVDGLNGVWQHINTKANIAVIAKASHSKLAALVKTKGWTLPVISSNGSTFNHDNNVEFLEADVGKKLENNGTKEVKFAGQKPAVSVFRKVDGKVYLTYQTFARGLEQVSPILRSLDLLPDGRGSWQPDHREDYPKA